LSGWRKPQNYFGTLVNMEITINEAFDIEKQSSKNWNLFLYDLAIQKLVDTDITMKEFDDKEFDSWFIERENKRVVYDGKDAWLLFQTKNNSDWTDIDTIKKDELNYSNFVRLINRLKEI
jgi:hypothetical protein